MADAKLEREVKLAAWPGFRLPDLGGVAGFVQADAAVSQQLDAVYYDAADLRRVLRGSADDATLDTAIQAAIARKPKGHDFIIDRRQPAPAVGRHMSVTGG